MADTLNADVVNVRDVTAFTAETDISQVEFYSRKGSTNKKMDGAVLVSEVVDKADLGTFTGTTIPDNQDIKEALQSLETAVEAVSGGGVSYSNLDLGKLQAIGVTGEVAYAGVAGSGIITIDDPWSLNKGDLYIDASTDVDGGGNFALTITLTNGTYNTWNGTGTHDLWIPQIHVYDIGATALATQLGVDVSLGATNVVDPQITWAANSVTYTFSGATDFGTLSRVLVTIKP